MNHPLNDHSLHSVQNMGTVHVACIGNSMSISPNFGQVVGLTHGVAQ